MQDRVRARQPQTHHKLTNRKQALACDRRPLCSANGWLRAKTWRENRGFKTEVRYIPARPAASVTVLLANSILDSNVVALGRRSEWPRARRRSTTCRFTVRDALRHVPAAPLLASSPTRNAQSSLH